MMFHNHNFHFKDHANENLVIGNFTETRNMFVLTVNVLRNYRKQHITQDSLHSFDTFNTCYILIVNVVYQMNKKFRVID